jgi:DNA-directed RNA polymerase specialized sigma24 family protein
MTRTRASPSRPAAARGPGGHRPGDPGQERRTAGLGRAGRPVRPADLVHLPQEPAGGRRRPGRLAQARRPAGQDPRPGRASRLAVTTRRECGRIARAARRPCDAGHALAAGAIPDDHAQAAGQDLLATERHAARREAFGQLPPGCQQLLALLTEDPALSYAEISARLGIPAGSIGPTRRHCLDELRRHPAITALINPDT